MLDFLNSMTGVLLGALITLWVARRYYVRASQDLRGKASELHRLTTLVLRGLENAGLVGLNKDEKGNIIDLIIGREVAASLDAILVPKSENDKT